MKYHVYVHLPKNKENYIQYLNFDNMNIQIDFRIKNIIVSLVR